MNKNPIQPKVVTILKQFSYIVRAVNTLRCLFFGSSYGFFFV